MSAPAINLGQPTPSIWPAAAGGVVIGGDFQGLGIARSLGGRGLPTCIIDDERSISRFSRYATHFVKVEDLRDEQETIAAVLDAGRRLNLKGWVLYPTRDETVAAFSKNRDALSEWFRVPTPGWATTEWAWDKRKTYELANKIGVATPTTWFPRCGDDLRRMNASFPLVIKPAIKEHFIYETKVKAWRADNREELARRFEQAAVFVPPGEIMIQDLIPGGSEQMFGYCAFFKNGSALGTMITQYKRQHPPLFGSSCTRVETVESPEVEELAIRFLRAMNYYGLVEIEFKLDPRDNRYKLLDVNARTWGYHSLGAAAGVDFSRMLFQDQLGQPVPTCRGRVGVSWVRLFTDVPTGLMEIFRGRRKALEYLRSLKSFDVEAVFSWADPLPGLAELAILPYLSIKRRF